MSSGEERPAAPRVVRRVGSFRRLVRVLRKDADGTEPLCGACHRWRVQKKHDVCRVCELQRCPRCRASMSVRRSYGDGGECTGVVMVCLSCDNEDLHRLARSAGK